MQSLEQILAEVERLRAGLDAEIVVQEEEGEEFEEYCHSGHLDGPIQNRDGSPKVKYVVTQPRITKPNLQKQEEAKQQLQQVYDSSEWYSARYVAGRALGIKDNEPESRLSNWINELERKLQSEIVVQEEEGHCGKTTWLVAMGEVEGEEYFIDKPRIVRPDIEKRKKAIEDVSKLYILTDNNPNINSMLKEAYKNNESKNVRIESGKTLGYSRLRIFIHEHPIVSLAAASSLGYFIYQYLTR